MFERIIKNDLTSDEPRAWLRHVVTEDLTRIQSSRAVRALDRRRAQTAPGGKSRR